MGHAMAETGGQKPHADEPGLLLGADARQAQRGAIVLHGHGDSAVDSAGMVRAIDPGGVAYRLPQADDGAWYPHRFTVPRSANEPWLDGALTRIATDLAALVESGIPVERIALVGFSQGACLALDFAARYPRRYGAVIALAGGLIGERIDAAAYSGDLALTPVLLAVSDDDPYIPMARVRETTAVLARLGAQIDCRTYHGLGHWVGADALAAARDLLAGTGTVPPPDQFLT